MASLDRILGIVVPVVVCWWTRQTLKRMKKMLKQTLSATPTVSESFLTSSVAVETMNEDEEFLQIKQYDNDVTLLKDMYAGDWCYDKTLVILTELMTITEALEKMHNSKATCALLYSCDDSLVGILDTRDIVQFILRSTSSMSCHARKAVRQCIVAPTHISVNEICKHLCTGMRYIAVCSSHGGHQIVSQRAMVSAIVNAAHTDDELLQHLSTAIPTWCLKRLICCNKDESAKRAFELMSAYNITSLPIVDQHGLARGVISATDVMYARNDIESLNLPTMTFVEYSRKDAHVSRNANCIVSCKPSDELIVVLRIMMHEAVHHAYILDNDLPVGVVSFTDILKYLLHVL
jgi:CBS domain-containing protein